MATVLKEPGHSYLQAVIETFHRSHTDAQPRLRAAGAWFLSRWRRLGGATAVVGLVYTMVAFHHDLASREENRINQAWSLIAAAKIQDVGNIGLVKALEYLYSRGRSLAEIQLPGAHLYRVDLTGADLNVADLRDANLISAELGGTNLHTADLSKARLIGANLKQAILSKAILADADLSSAELDGAHFCDTTMPDGSSCHRDCTPDEVEHFGISNEHCPWLVTVPSAIE